MAEATKSPTEKKPEPVRYQITHRDGEKFPAKETKVGPLTFVGGKAETACEGEVDWARRHGHKVAVAAPAAKPAEKAK